MMGRQLEECFEDAAGHWEPRPDQRDVRSTARMTPRCGGLRVGAEVLDYCNAISGGSRVIPPTRPFRGPQRTLGVAGAAA